LDTARLGQDETLAQGAEDGTPMLDPALAALCAPISETDPCGPDLDAEGDADYLNFVAQIDGILPTSFFSPEDGKPFDPTTVDIDGQLGILRTLLARTRDIRLALVEARLAVLQRDTEGFTTAVAAIAEWLDRYWDEVHPRPEGGNADARARAIAALDSPTVVFPLQYSPLFDTRRIGPVTYRRWLIATGEVRPRAGDAEVAASAITQARDEADAAVLALTRQRMARLDRALGRIRKAFATHGSEADLGNLSALVGKILAFVDRDAARPDAPASENRDGADPLEAKQDGAAVGAAGPPPASLADATRALAAIADYYSRREPSSPILPLVRQAHALVGKSFLEIMTILVPSQVEKAAFQLGTDQVFDLPVGKLSGLSAVAPAAVANGSGEGADPAEPARPRYHVESRQHAIALLDSVQQFFRLSEPSSPVPMLCQRARAMADRDFMSVLRDVLPKAALRNVNADK
jgi:type VI secretion system protein ImpA